MASTFVWTGPGSGSWNEPDLWFDVTQGTTATVSPGKDDIATIGGPDTGAITVSGPAVVDSLTLNGGVVLNGTFAIDGFTVAHPSDVPTGGTTTSNVTLAGSFTASSLTVGSLFLVPGLSSDQVNNGTITLGAGDALSAGTIALNAGELQADAATVTVSGIVTLGSILLSPRPPLNRLTAGTLELTNNAQAQLGGLRITNGGISLDATSILEIGTAGVTTPGTITIDAGYTLAVGDYFVDQVAVTIGAPVLNNGTIVDDGFTDLSDIVNNGLISVRASRLSDIDGQGVIAVGDGVIIGQGVHGTADIAFSSTSLTIDLGPGITIDVTSTPLISGLETGDSLQLSGIVADSVHYVPAGSTSGTLVLDNAGTMVASLALLGSYSDADFAIAGGSTVNVAIPCFAPGTRIRTSRGDVPVEMLQTGDEIATLVGAPFRNVRHMRQRTVDGRRQPEWTAWGPVRIARDAFADNAPHRTVWLSPDHAVFADGMLVPVKYLLNGATIRQVRRRSMVYWHVELDAHDVMLADGLPVESYLSAADLTPTQPTLASLVWEAAGCAPLVVTGPALDRLHHRLARRAVWLSQRGSPMAA